MKLYLSGQFDSKTLEPVAGQIKSYFKYFPDDVDINLFDWRFVKNNVASLSLNKDGLQKNQKLDDADAVLIRQLGSIYDSKTDFLGFLADLKNLNVPVINDPDKMLANLDKQYLIDLYNAGLSVIPSYLYDSKTDSLEKVLTQVSKNHGAAPIILKPRFLGEGGNGILKVDGLYTGDLVQDHVVQPFIEDIKNGEVSMFYLGDEFSHALLKKSTSGDYRVNYNFGIPLYSKFDADTVLKNKSKEFINYMGDHNQVLRLDYVLTPKGPLLMEYESVNPAPYAEEIGVSKQFSHALANFIKRHYN